VQTLATVGCPSANCKAAAGSVTPWASHTSAIVVTRPSSSVRSDPRAPNRTKLGIVVYLSLGPHQGTPITGTQPPLAFMGDIIESKKMKR
jgi:hypothetical protein